jgi:hypothetical protein
VIGIIVRIILTLLYILEDSFIQMTYLIHTVFV